jgi:hypothetical protein
VSATIVLHRLATEPSATVALPEAWHAAELGAPAVQEAVRLVGSWPALAESGLRADAERTLAEILTQVAADGARFAAILAGDKGLPVCASVVAAGWGVERLSAADIETRWLAEGRTCTRLSLPVGPGVAGEQFGTGEAQAPWELRIAVPARRGGGILFVFASPVAELADALRTVATAIVSTMRWNHPGRM